MKRECSCERASDRAIERNRERICAGALGAPSRYQKLI
jgi:hypothetical protein